MKRTARNYNGSETTSHTLNALLPKVLSHLQDKFSDRPDLILAAWPSLIGPHLAPMTQAIYFQNGILTVKVKNSVTHSVLNLQKSSLTVALRKKFPHVTIKTILFRIG
jgi:hypothetical protein